MNRITGEDGQGAAPREVLQVTLSGPQEIAAAMALTCAGYKMLEFYVCVQVGKHGQAQAALQAAGDLLDKATDVIPPAVFHAVHAKLHTAGGAAANESSN